MIVYYLGLANVQTDNQTYRHDRTSCTQCVIHVAYSLLQIGFLISLAFITVICKQKYALICC